MKVLIIEDSDYKIRSLCNFLKDADMNADIQVAKSFQSGKKALKEFNPALVLLDMTLPTSEKSDGQLEGRSRMLGGRDMMAEMDILDIKCKVIVVTQFDSFGEPPNTIEAKDLFNILLNKYPKLFLGGVYYSNVDSTWQKQLSQLLRRMARK